VTALSQLGRAALTYAEHGWFVLPLVPQEKTPWAGYRTFQAPQGEGGYKLASRNLEHLQAAWTIAPQCNVGIRPGPSGLLIADIDHGAAEAVAEYMGLIAEPTLTALSGRDPAKFPRARHLYFAHRTPIIGKLWLVLRNGRLATADSKHEALELFGHIGYAVAPPSIHPETGRRYRWLNWGAPLLQFPARVLDSLITEDPTASRGPAGVVIGDIPTPGRNETLASFAGTMRRRGMSVAAITAALRVENATRCQPPLPEAEVDTIARSVGRYSPETGPQQRRRTPYTFTPGAR
jgi:hypothetical protein